MIELKLIPLVERATRFPRPCVDLSSASVELTYNCFAGAPRWSLPGATARRSVSGVSESAGAFACPNCGLVYSLKRNLQRHLRLECGQEPRYPCPVCAFRSKRRNNLRSHMLNRHPGALMPWVIPDTDRREVLYAHWSADSGAAR